MQTFGALCIFIAIGCWIAQLLGFGKDEEVEQPVVVNERPTDWLKSIETIKADGTSEFSGDIMPTEGDIIKKEPIEYTNENGEKVIETKWLDKKDFIHYVKMALDYEGDD